MTSLHKIQQCHHFVEALYGRAPWHRMRFPPEVKWRTYMVSYIISQQQWMLVACRYLVECCIEVVYAKSLRCKTRKRVLGPRFVPWCQMLLSNLTSQDVLAFAWKDLCKANSNQAKMFSWHLIVLHQNWDGLPVFLYIKVFTTRYVLQHLACPSDSNHRSSKNPSVFFWFVPPYACM